MPLPLLPTSLVGSYAQPEWLTVLRRDIEAFKPDLIVGEIIDFYALHRV